MSAGFHCQRCGQFHEELPMAYGAPAPIYYYQVDETERSTRCELYQEHCVIDDQFYFIRGCLEIPVIDSDQVFDWGVWCSLSRESYQMVFDSWNSEDRTALQPLFGWLSTSIPFYEETVNLKSLVHIRSVGIRPFVELEPTNHPLAVEQRQGITLDRIREIAERMLHDDHNF